MWYGVETVFIDGVLFGSRCCFEDGDTGPEGHCFASLDEEPGNSCKKEFDDRIEIHLDWFESEQLAKDFQSGKITYEHVYDTYYKESIKSTLSRFRERKIIQVDIEKGIFPHRGICTKNQLTNKPFWA